MKKKIEKRFLWYVLTSISSNIACFGCLSVSVCSHGFALIINHYPLIDIRAHCSYTNTLHPTQFPSTLYKYTAP